MLAEKDLQAISKLMDLKLEPIKQDLSELKESAEITRDAANRLVEWAENVSNAIRFPLPKI